MEFPPRLDNITAASIMLLAELFVDQDVPGCGNTLHQGMTTNAVIYTGQHHYSYKNAKQ
jgi:hypothetical protein